MSEKSALAEIETDRFIRSLYAGLATSDVRLQRHGGYMLCQLLHTNEQYRTAGIDALIQWAIRQPYRDPVLRTLATLRQRHDATIKERFLALADRHRAKVLYDRLSATRPWEVSLEEEANQTVVRVGELGPLQIPAEIIQRYADPHQGDREATTAENRHLKTTSPERDREWSHFSRLERLERMPHGEAFVAVEDASIFDEFEFLGPELETRYGHVVQARTLQGSTEDIVILRLYATQDDIECEQELGSQLRAWSAVDSGSVTAVADCGTSPRPWVAVEHTDGTLWERGRLSPDELLTSATELTGALAALHQRDLVHGGIDPHSIRLTPSMLEEPAAAKLDNVGLAPVYRRYDNPASYIDPRYAGPEYFGDQYGGIDHATDIYQLGMALFTAATGEPPYEGSFEEIQRGVLTTDPVEGALKRDLLSARLGEILTRATANEKMQRFETATQFHQAVRSVSEPVS